MRQMPKGPLILLSVACLALTGCGAGGGGSFGGLFGGRAAKTAAQDPTAAAAAAAASRAQPKPTRRATIWDLFRDSGDVNATVTVNKYLWKASLEVLGFLPVETVDPFTGVIVTGYGVPPGGGRAYRATVLVQDAALDARSLKLSMQGRGGAPVDADTVRAVEDAILTRARQLRIQDSKL